MRNAFFDSLRGFSMGSTVIAVLIGGLSAALIATLVTRAVAGQRAIIDRDEMSEFSVFVKGLLTRDAVCNSSLLDKTFLPGGKTDLELAVPYGKKSGPIGKGFTFAGDKLSVAELSIEDRGDAPIPMTLRLASSRTPVPLNRHMARVKLQLSHADGSTYRSRFFDLPLLVDSRNQIKACNNEFTVSDACQAMGFEWNNETSPPTCVPKNVCVTGGTYKVISAGLFGRGGCGLSNPATGACRCPAGFTDTIAGAADVAMFCGRFCFLTFNLVHQCLRCPQ
ncbi:MAG: hypothetical protein KF799_08705 [Bdellovibrionales bacterium]|nr:hypothetical protein [Bdellovibrionales bacterium]